MLVIVGIILLLMYSYKGQVVKSIRDQVNYIEGDSWSYVSINSVIRFFTVSVFVNWLSNI